MSISKDAQRVLDRAGKGARDYVYSQGGFGNRLTSGEAKRLLTGFTADNINSVGSVKRPTDLLGIRDQIYSDTGVTGLQERVISGQEGLDQYNVDTARGMTDLADKRVSMSKITGRQGIFGDRRSQTYTGMGAAQQALVSSLSAAQSEAQFRFEVAQNERTKIEQLMMAAPLAGISYADSYEMAVGKYGDELERLEEQEIERLKEAKKDGDYDALFAAYGTTAGSRPKGMSKKEYLKQLEKQYGSMADTLSERSKYSTSGGSGSSSNTYLKDVIVGHDEVGEPIKKTVMVTGIDENGELIVTELYDDTIATTPVKDDNDDDGGGGLQTGIGDTWGKAKSIAGRWWDRGGMNKGLRTDDGS